MILVINSLLNSDELVSVRALYDQHAARDGSATAGAGIEVIKNNRELDLGGSAGQLKDLVLGACNRPQELQYAMLPKVISSPILSCYGVGMYYGTHVDSAIGEDQGRTFRTDLSTTIFLDDPSSYGGGELVIHAEQGAQSYKLAAGDAVFYPTVYLHEVTEVTRGQRRVCIFWTESLVRDPRKREILYNLTQLGSWIGQREPATSEPRQKLIAVRENLLPHVDGNLGARGGRKS